VSANSALTHFNLVYLSSFVLFEFQTKLVDQLVNFTHLKQLVIEHHEFHLTGKLLAVLKSLTNLTSIKITTRKLETGSLSDLNKVIVNIKLLLNCSFTYIRVFV